MTRANEAAASVDDLRLGRPRDLHQLGRRDRKGVGPHDVRLSEPVEGAARLVSRLVAEREARSGQTHFPWLGRLIGPSVPSPRLKPAATMCGGRAYVSKEGGRSAQIHDLSNAPFRTSAHLGRAHRRRQLAAWHADGPSVQLVAMTESICRVQVRERRRERDSAGTARVLGRRFASSFRVGSSDRVTSPRTIPGIRATLACSAVKAISAVTKACRPVPGIPVHPRA